MRISTSGRVTIPRRIRTTAGLLPGTEVEFALEGDAIRIIKVGAREPKSIGQQAVELLRNAEHQTRSTTDEIMAMTRGDD